VGMIREAMETHYERAVFVAALQVGKAPTACVDVGWPLELGGMHDGAPAAPTVSGPGEVNRLSHGGSNTLVGGFVALFQRSRTL